MRYFQVDTAIKRKVVGKGARDNLERYCGCFLVNFSSKKFERMAREAMDLCLQVLKESNKSRFDSYSVRNKCIDHIPYYLFGFVACTFFATTSLEIAVYQIPPTPCTLNRVYKVKLKLVYICTILPFPANVSSRSSSN